MCGIVGYVGHKEAVPVLIAGLGVLEYRGYDSAGISVFNHGIVSVKAKGRLSELEKAVTAANLESSNIGIGHTRWATHGVVNKTNSHPHTSMKKQYSIVHNGIIENYIELKEELIAEGYYFKSDTDSEVVAHLLERLDTGNILETINLVAKRLKGSYALAIMHYTKPNCIYGIRKDSPLVIGLGVDENFLASDISAFSRYTKQFLLLEDHELVMLQADQVIVYDKEGNVINKVVEKIVEEEVSVDKANHDYFMMKEMLEQPELMNNLIQELVPNSEIKLDGLSKLNLTNLNKIHIVACGSAYHVGMVAKNFIESVCRIEVEADIASEFRYRNPILKDNDLVIVISQSGETADTLAALREAKLRGIQTLAIVNAPGSNIARDSDALIYTKAGKEVAVATTKAYSNQLLVMYLLGIYLAKHNQLIDESEYQRLIIHVKALPHIVSNVLKLEPKMEALAKVYAYNEKVFILGRGVDYVASLEASLKLKEITYINSQAYPAGELKHGTISLIEEDVLVINLATQADLLDKTISNVKEVKARGAKVLSITTKQAHIIDEASDEVVYLGPVADLFSASISIIVMQLFAYHSAIVRGCDVDKPRNLAKSVTVE